MESSVRLTALIHYAQRLIGLFIVCPLLLSAEGLLLVNSNVPMSKTLVEGYRALHPKVPMRIIELDLAPMESIEMDMFLEVVRAPLLKGFVMSKAEVEHSKTGGTQAEAVSLDEDARGEKKFPDWILSFYGLPLWVKDGKRVRSFDQCLSLLAFPKDLNGKLVLNPLYFDEQSNWAPILVSRLDGPALRHAEGVLDAWAQLRNWGGFRRVFSRSKDGDFVMRAQISGHLCYDLSWLGHTPLREVQFLEAGASDLTNALDDRDQRERFSPGAVVIHHHEYAGMGRGDFKGGFRRGRSIAAKVLGFGVSFCIGGEQPQNPEEDLFDSDAFGRLYFSGGTFLKSAFGALPSLGGSMLIIGDPLARPYHPSWEKNFESGLSPEASVGAPPKQLMEIAHSRDWWLARDYLRFWEQGKFEMVMGLLGVAIQRRENPLFYELLMDFCHQLGRRRAMEDLWKSWNRGRDASWVQARAEKLWFTKGLRAVEGE